MRRRSLIATPALLLAAPAARAQRGFPNRPIRLVVGFPPGGTTDIAARLMAPKMSAALGQPVVVENRPGAGGNIASEYVVRAAPDGHTLLMGTIAALSVNPTLYSDLSFDPRRDLTPITRVALILNVLSVPVDKPWRNVGDLVAAARRAPLTFGSSGTGGAGHLAGEQLNLMAGLQNIHVPYRGGAPMVTDLISGKLDFAFTPASGVDPQVEAGRLRNLAVSTRARSRLAPDVPTVAESAGLPDFDMTDWSALMAPRGLPPEVREAIVRAAAAALADPELVGALASRRVETVPSTPAELDGFIAEETAKWAPIVRASGATPG